MELAVQSHPPPPPPRYIVFDLSGAGLRCSSPPPAAEHIGVPFDTHAMHMGFEALHRTRLSRAVLATNRPIRAGGTVMARSVHAGTGGPDTVSGAGTPGVQLAEESGDDEVDSFDAFFCRESTARKIDALAELVGLKGAYEPMSVLGEVVRVLQSIHAN